METISQDLGFRVLRANCPNYGVSNGQESGKRNVTEIGMI